MRLRSGLHVHVQELGAPNAEPVLFLAGWACPTGFYARNLPAVAGAGFRAIAVDLKGHGASDKPLRPGEYTLEAMAEHVLEIIDALDLECPILVGQSMGGRIALEVARRAPDRVRALVLIAPVGIASMAFARAASAAAWLPPTPMLPRLTGRWLVSWLLHRVYGDPSRVTNAEVEMFAECIGSPDYIYAMHRLLREFTWRPIEIATLRRLSVPMLLILGGSDRLVRVRPGQLARRYPGVFAETGSVPVSRTAEVPEHRRQVLWVRGVGHAVNLEAPELTNAALLAFLGAPSA